MQDKHTKPELKRHIHNGLIFRPKVHRGDIVERSKYDIIAFGISMHIPIPKQTSYEHAEVVEENRAMRLEQWHIQGLVGRNAVLIFMQSKSSTLVQQADSPRKGISSRHG